MLVPPPPPHSRHSPAQSPPLPQPNLLPIWTFPAQHPPLTSRSPVPSSLAFSRHCFQPIPSISSSKSSGRFIVSPSSVVSKQPQSNQRTSTGCALAAPKADQRHRLLQQPTSPLSRSAGFGLAHSRRKRQQIHCQKKCRCSSQPPAHCPSRPCPLSTQLGGP